VSQTGIQETAGQAAGAQASAANQGAVGAAGQSSGATTQQGAAGATSQRPASLPRTGDPSSPVLGIVLASLLALIGGWSLRRRAR
jgi:LPXTG-motif cell wall-anchored protein